MPKKKQPKHPMEMTSDEVANMVFHPKVLKHAKRHVKRLNAGAKTRKRSK